MSVILLHATDDMLRSTPRRPAAAWVAVDREWGATGGCAPACKRRQSARSSSVEAFDGNQTPSTVVSNGTAKFSSIIVNQPVICSDSL
jgi:hypothetical protein